MLSGGVDSAVAGLLLKRQGFDVRGVFVRTWVLDDPRFPCTTREDFESAKSAASALQIPLELWDFTKPYWDRIVSRMLEEYRAGLTPNPDVWCNREIKFGLFLERALEEGAWKIATGHHVRIREEQRSYALLVGKDEEKDQSYFLWQLTQEQLSRAIFPVGEFTKDHVRQMAQCAGLENWNRRSSRGLCFVGQIKFSEFLREHIPSAPGTVVTSDGKVVGSHSGIATCTIGQREGLGIPLKERFYVAEKDPARNRIVLAKEDEPLLWKNEVRVCRVHWTSRRAPSLPRSLSARVRYRQKLQRCTVRSGDGKNEVRVTFSSPQRALAAGQSLVLYDRERLVGGGVMR